MTSSLSTSPPVESPLPRSSSYQPGDPLFAALSTSAPSPAAGIESLPFLSSAASSSQAPSPVATPVMKPAPSPAPSPNTFSFALPAVIPVLTASSPLLSHPSHGAAHSSALTFSSYTDPHLSPSHREGTRRLEGVPEEGSERGEGQPTARPGTSTATKSGTAAASRTRRSDRPPQASAASSSLVSSSSSLSPAAVKALLDDNKSEAWQKLMNLKSLLSAGFITRTEYRDRKSQLIDEMTGTTLSSITAPSSAAASALTSTAATTFSSSTTRRHAAHHAASSRAALDLPTIVPRGPPDFTKVVAEKATKYTYDLVSRSWNATSVLVKLDPVPFSRGALRLVYHLLDLEEAGEEKERVRLMREEEGRRGREERREGEETPSVSVSGQDLQALEHSGASSIASDSSSCMSTVSSLPSSHDADDGCHLPIPSPLSPLTSGPSAGATYVAKISMDPRDNEDREIYFRDVEMQTLARYYAHLFNEYQPPKLVDFVKASILRLEEREGQPLCGVERYIEGTYRKWNNNFGFVSEDERNTPQAFSHFTYESSNHRLLICDIQGVSDSYTDPQVHSVDMDGFGGKGNLGQRGIERFLSTHRCNAICRYLKLPSINANYSDLGTLPITQYMSYEQVKVVNIHHFPRTSVSQQLLTPTHTHDVKPADSPELMTAATAGGPGLHGMGEMEDQHCKGFCSIL